MPTAPLSPRFTPPLTRLALLAVLATANAFAPSLASQEPGIVGRSAPAWTVDAWHNLPAGQASLDIDELRGKVIYLFCFQSWCPGCHSHGFPTLQAVHERFGVRDDVAFVAVQTVFEGFASNTVHDGRRTMEELGLTIPWAQAEGKDHASPALMRAYRTGGTPWTVIIDPSGVVRWNGFGIRPEDAIAVVEKLLPPPPAEHDAASR